MAKKKVTPKKGGKAVPGTPIPGKKGEFPFKKKKKK